MWANNTSHTFSVYTGGRTVTAQISLARIQTAASRRVRAFIRSYCYYSSSDVVLCPFNPDTDNESTTVSAIKISRATHITFELQAPNSFAYAVIMVFFHG
jgi:hypothetical protein